MQIYLFKCSNCKSKFEYRNNQDGKNKDCPVCGSLKTVEKLLSVPGEYVSKFDLRFDYA